MKITIEQMGSVVTVSTEKEGLDIDAVMDILIVPALLALGYTQNTIDGYFDGANK